MLFVALLFAAVCAKNFTFELKDDNNAGTKILKTEAQLELLYQRNHEKLTEEYMKKTKEDFALTADVSKLKETVADVEQFTKDVAAKTPFKDATHQKKAEELFKEFQTPADDFICRIAENERLCTAQANNFPNTFATSFSAKAWEEIEKLDKTELKTFKDVLKISGDKVTTDTKEAYLGKFALEGCKLAAFRAHFKNHAAHDDHKSSVPTFGLTAILAAATLAF